MTNREFSKTDKRFVEACESAEVRPTVRQASKWRRDKGKAWKWGGAVIWARIKSREESGNGKA